MKVDQTETERQSLGETTAFGGRSINNASCELNDDYLIEQFCAINQKCGECVEVYKKHHSIVENEKAAYAYAEKTLRSQMEKTRAEIELRNEYVIDEKTDSIWKFLAALERSKLRLAQEMAKTRKN